MSTQSSTQPKYLFSVYKYWHYEIPEKRKTIEYFYDLYDNNGKIVVKCKYYGKYSPEVHGLYYSQYNFLQEYYDYWMSDRKGSCPCDAHDEEDEISSECTMVYIINCPGCDSSVEHTPAKFNDEDEDDEVYDTLSSQPITLSELLEYCQRQISKDARNGDRVIMFGAADREIGCVALSREDNQVLFL